ncbi:hypothetical protein VCHA29O37_210042 [Vibrio chagasii]|nr:hypothetical protein VCHA29O37_210042 [Vibrio chagasii]
MVRNEYPERILLNQRERKLMGLAIINSRASVGVEAPEVTVEVHISNGMPGFTLVGLPETTVKESKDRVRSAIINSRFEFPSKRITDNLMVYRKKFRVVWTIKGKLSNDKNYNSLCPIFFCRTEKRTQFKASD